MKSVKHWLQHPSRDIELRSRRQSRASVGPLFLCVLGLGAFLARGDDWPQWGGTSSRNMYSPAKGLPDHFTKEKSTDIKFKAGTDDVDQSNIENLKWVAKIG